MGAIELNKDEGPIDYHPERMAEARVQRQRALLLPAGPTYEVVLDEFVLRRLAVPPLVMEKQLRHLIDVVSHEPRLTVHVLPVDAPLFGGLLPKSSFTLYTFPDPEDRPMAVTDTVNADLIYTEPDAVSRYAGHYARLESASLSPAASLSLLWETADRLANKKGQYR